MEINVGFDRNYQLDEDTGVGWISMSIKYLKRTAVACVATQIYVTLSLHPRHQTKLTRV
jgi:hypothetical protein